MVDVEKHYHELLEEQIELGGELSSLIPGVYSGFKRLHHEAMSDGAIPVRVEEAFALAIPVTNQCDGCVTYHAHAAAHRGTSDEEAAEALSVAILLSGAPGTVYVPRAWEAFQEFRQQIRAGGET